MAYCSRDVKCQGMYDRLNNDSRTFFIIGINTRDGGCPPVNGGCDTGVTPTTFGPSGSDRSPTKDIEAYVGTGVTGGVMVVEDDLSVPNVPPPNNYRHFGDVAKHELYHMVGRAQTGQAVEHAQMCGIPGAGSRACPTKQLAN